jgi:hypothetical protein
MTPMVNRAIVAFPRTTSLGAIEFTVSLVGDETT